MTHDFACRYEKIRAFAEKFLADGGLSPVISKRYIIVPGLCDVHVHFRDPGFTYKEDIYTGAKAAAAGGFTTVVLMANTKPCVDNIETLKYVIEKGKSTDINILSVANVTEGMKGCKLTDFEGLYKAGAVGVSDDGVPIMDADLVKEAFLQAKKLNISV